MKKGLILLLMSVWLFNMNGQTPNWANMIGKSPEAGNMTSMFVDSATNTLYLGGRFEYIAGKKCRGAARWNGTAWDSMGIGFDRANPAPFSGNVHKILKYKNKIYYFGTFLQAGPYNTGGMAIWNGTAWDSVGPFPNGNILDADIYKDTLYVAGDFTKMGAMTCSSVAKFDGTNWYNNLSFPYGAFGIRVYKNKIYIVGIYYTNGYSLTAEWDYINGWKPSLGVQGNTAKTMWGLERVDSLLYFYGRFTHLSTMYSPSICGYSGTQLYGVGDGAGLNNYPTVMNITPINGKAYLVGIFESMGGMAIPGTNLGVAELSGNQYCIYGDNFDNSVSDMVGYNNELLISGSFWKVNNDSIWKVAKWIGGNYTYSCSTFTPLVSVIQDYDNVFSSIKVYPNPSSDKLNIDFDMDTKEIKLYISNTLGQTLKVINSPTQHEQIDISRLPQGIYFLRFQIDNSQETIKFIKE